MMTRSDLTTRVIEGLLWLVAAWCALFGLLWVLGSHGLQWLDAGDIPNWLAPILVNGPQGDWTGIPQIGAALNPAESLQVGALFSHLFPIPGEHSPLGTPNNWGEVAPGGAVVNLWGPTGFQHHVYMAVHVLAYALVAVIAVVLARMVADSRRGSPFVRRNVMRLFWIGWLVIIGTPVISWANWACLRWIFNSSTASGHVARTVGYSWESLPWWSMLIGAVVLILATVWRSGVQMADDVAGLV